MLAALVALLTAPPMASFDCRTILTTVFDGEGNLISQDVSCQEIPGASCSSPNFCKKIQVGQSTEWCECSTGAPSACWGIKSGTRLFANVRCIETGCDLSTPDCVRFEIGWTDLATNEQTVQHWCRCE